MTLGSCVLQSVHGNCLLANPDTRNKPERHVRYLRLRLHEGEENARELGLPHRFVEPGNILASAGFGVFLQISEFHVAWSAFLLVPLSKVFYNAHAIIHSHIHSPTDGGRW